MIKNNSLTMMGIETTLTKKKKVLFTIIIIEKQYSFKNNSLTMIRQNIHWSLTLLEQRPREKLQGHPSFSLIYKSLFNPSQFFSFSALTNTTMEDNHTKKPQNAVVLTTARLPVLPFRRTTPLLLPHKLEPHLSQRHR